MASRIAMPKNSWSAVETTRSARWSRRLYSSKFSA
jgi:hypothetical protein